MEQQVSSFGRFYASFNKLPGSVRSDDYKDELVSQYTGGRTTSLKQMTRQEYDQMCAGLERVTQDEAELRHMRSGTLKLMQKLGVDTTDWAQINDFCRHPRIAAKEFYKITIDEHAELQKKLRSISRKGWQRRKAPEAATPKKNNPVHLILMQMGTIGHNHFHARKLRK